ncbi:protein serine/threonine phosphatase 2C [Ramaria rubella]|nr:protein serine/threonine phosphatase 2C [Ramaria rubella]
MSFLRKPSRALAAVSFLGIATSSYLYYRHREDINISNQTFELFIRGRDSSGNRVNTKRVMPLLPPGEVERRLRAFAKTGGALRDGVQWNWHTAQVPANDPVEDAFSSVIVERDPPLEKENTQQSSNGDLLFFTILDGHSGPYTSRLLSKTLIPTVALELSSLMHQPVPNSPPTASSTLSYLRSFAHPILGSTPSTPKTFDQSPTYVSLAIQTAFARLDSELINAPIRLLESMATSNKEAIKSVDEKTDEKPSEDALALATIRPALSGSCALLALLDTGARNMYVACTGDSRAVAGYFDEATGIWTMEVLTEDQTGRNPNELKRMQSEHPPDETDSVIQRGRVLGGLEPTRAFGDARYKWSREIQERLMRTFFESARFPPRLPPVNLKTPPYVTSQPVVTYRTEFLPPATASPSTTPQSKMRFLILATDGLWDTLSSQDACALVAGHLAGLRGTVPKQELEGQLNLTVGTQGIEGKDKGQASKAKDGESWQFKDMNLATHLVRNAFGGGDEQRLRELMSIPPPLARSYRDDITVTVVWWEDSKGAQTQQIRAKL